MATGLARGMYEPSFVADDHAGRSPRRCAATAPPCCALSDDYLERDTNGHYAPGLTSYNPIYCLDHPETRSVAQIAAQARRTGQAVPAAGGLHRLGRAVVPGLAGRRRDRRAAS